MSTLIFDTLAFSKKLKCAGFTDQQAEGQAEAFAELFETKIATKQDIEAFHVATKQDIDSLRISTKQDIQILKNDIQKDFIIFKKEMLISIGSMIGAAVVILPAIFKLINLI
jgi:hypothetical protein